MAIQITQNKRYLIVTDTNSVDASINYIKPFEVYKSHNDTKLTIKNHLYHKTYDYDEVILPGSINIDNLVAILIDYNNNDHVTDSIQNLTVVADEINVSVIGVEERIGNKDELPAPTDTSTSGLNGLIKRILQYLNIIEDNQVDSNNTLVDILNNQVDGDQKTQLVNSSNEEIGTPTKPIYVSVNNQVDLGTDGDNPPAIPGTGVRGWLRSIYEFIISTVYDYSEFNYNIPKELGSEIIIPVSRYNSIGFSLVVPTGGEVQFLGSFDGSLFNPITLRSTGSDGWTKVSFSNDDFIGSVASMRLFKIKVIIAGSANGTIGGKLNKQVCTIEGIEHSNPPHNIGHEILRKSFEFIVAQTNTPILTPPTGYKWVITDILFSSDGNNEITIFDETNIPDNHVVKVRSGTERFFNHPFRGVNKSNSAGNSLRVTSTSPADFRGTIMYYLIR